MALMAARRRLFPRQPVPRTTVDRKWTIEKVH
jgi:hypothetical protein